VEDADQQQHEEATVSTTRGRGRGRAGRGDRGGRGDHQGGARKEHKAQQPPSASDFPELPSTSTVAPAKDTEAPKKLDFPIRTKTDDIKDIEPNQTGIKKQESFGLPSPMAGKSWADQVDDS
jgi:ribosomal protein L15